MANGEGQRTCAKEGREQRLRLGGVVSISKQRRQHGFRNAVLRETTSNRLKVDPAHEKLLKHQILVSNFVCISALREEGR